MKILEFHTRIMKIIKIQHVRMIIMKIIKIITFHSNIIKRIINFHELPCENNGTHENLRIPRENHENIEDLQIPHENHRIIKIKEFV